MAKRTLRSISKEAKAKERPLVPVDATPPSFEEVKDAEGNVIRRRFDSLADVKQQAYRDGQVRLVASSNMDIEVIEATTEEKTRLQARLDMEKGRLAAGRRALLDEQAKRSLARKTKPPTERE